MKKWDVEIFKGSESWTYEDNIKDLTLVELHFVDAVAVMKDDNDITSIQINQYEGSDHSVIKIKFRLDCLIENLQQQLDRKTLEILETMDANILIKHAYEIAVMHDVIYYLENDPEIFGDTFPSELDWDDFYSKFLDMSGHIVGYITTLQDAMAEVV